MNHREERLDPLARVELERPEQLLAFLEKDPYSLEPGLRILERSLATGGGEAIDLLGLDSAGAFVLIETKVGPDSALLERVLDHYDWFVGNLGLFRRLYGTHSPDRGLPPRAILVGPGFPPAMERRIRYLRGLPLDLVAYRAFLHGGSRFLALEPVGSNRKEEEPERAGERRGLTPLSEDEWREFERFEQERREERAAPPAARLRPMSAVPGRGGS
ncbi:MAG: hypothetical protein HY509_02535 [Acidobacteria bacterium]|nr:hypothetical protein [Acidobacteriota bacterium]